MWVRTVVNAGRTVMVVRSAVACADRTAVSCVVRVASVVSDAVARVLPWAILAGVVSVRTALGPQCILVRTAVARVVSDRSGIVVRTAGHVWPQTSGTLCGPDRTGKCGLGPQWHCGPDRSDMCGLGPHLSAVTCVVMDRSSIVVQAAVTSAVQTAEACVVSDRCGIVVRTAVACVLPRAVVEGVVSDRTAVRAPDRSGMRDPGGIGFCGPDRSAMCRPDRNGMCGLYRSVMCGPYPVACVVRVECDGRKAMK